MPPPTHPPLPLLNELPKKLVRQLLAKPLRPVPQLRLQRRLLLGQTPLRERGDLARRVVHRFQQRAVRIFQVSLQVLEPPGLDGGYVRREQELEEGLGEGGEEDFAQAREVGGCGGGDCIGHCVYGVVYGICFYIVILGTVGGWSRCWWGWYGTEVGLYISASEEREYA